MNSVIKISRHRNKFVEDCLIHTRQFLHLYHQDVIWKGSKRYAH